MCIPSGRLADHSRWCGKILLRSAATPGDGIRMQMQGLPSCCTPRDATLTRCSSRALRYDCWGSPRSEEDLHWQRRLGVPGALRDASCTQPRITVLHCLQPPESSRFAQSHQLAARMLPTRRNPLPFHDARTSCVTPLTARGSTAHAIDTIFSSLRLASVSLGQFIPPSADSLYTTRTNQSRAAWRGRHPDYWT